MPEYATTDFHAFDPRERARRMQPTRERWEVVLAYRRLKLDELDAETRVLEKKISERAAHTRQHAR